MSAPELVKPRLRGVSHQWAFFAAFAGGIALVATAAPGERRLAAAIFAVSVCALFATSAIYHRVNWASPAARLRMRRLDHTMIFFLIAGTYTPFALVTLDGGLGTVVLFAVWGGALAGTLARLVFTDAPKWVIAAPYPVLGWVAVAATPDLVDELGIGVAALLLLSGLLYTVGAVIYARQRPDPVPAVFGYHEVFHALVIVATAINYGIVAAAVLPE